MPRESAQDVVIGVSGASKTFRIPREAAHTLKERALHPLRRRGYDEFSALRDVSFNVRRGEFFGVVGRNGSGKSTLLKCLAGIYSLDRGQIVIDGRMSTFIELGVGFNPDLAARDNVIMNGIMLGLTAREGQDRYDEIIDFAELRDYQELKLKNYSSGMYVRLAFSVAIQVQADILLIDEVLAVGDASFQQKCYDVFNDMRDAGRTVLFVTHDMGSVARMCDRALLLEHGDVVMIDEPDAVANRYLELNFAREDVAGEPSIAEPVGAPVNGRAARFREAPDPPRPRLDRERGAKAHRDWCWASATRSSPASSCLTDIDDPAHRARPRRPPPGHARRDDGLRPQRRGSLQRGPAHRPRRQLRSPLAAGALHLHAHRRAPGCWASRADALRACAVVRRQRSLCDRRHDRPAARHRGAAHRRPTDDGAPGMSVAVAPRGPEMPAKGREVTGPSAFSGGARRFVALTRTMAVQEFKLRFFGSVLGYLWQLVRPLMIFGVLFVMFTVIFSVSTQPKFGVALLLGIVMYTFFAEATGTAVACVIDREHGSQDPVPAHGHSHGRRPDGVLQLRARTSAWSSSSPRSTACGRAGAGSALVPLVALLVVFASGIAMLLSALYVRYRDVQPIWTSSSRSPSTARSSSSRTRRSCARVTARSAASCWPTRWRRSCRRRAISPCTRPTRTSRTASAVRACC